MSLLSLLHYRPFLASRCLKIPAVAASSWQSQDVRSTFIEFFQNEGHQFVPSSSVLPKKGAGTYFTNAGMNQFKPLFLGEIEPSRWSPPVTRAVNSQKCIRVGGKHNDLEDVGNDLTHHTFFEMLGNWSFGDYFKVEACKMAHHLLTDRYKLPLDRLYFTYFAGDRDHGLEADLEVRDIWMSLGVPSDHILPFGVSDNFWEMGPTGPCGPCTEIHYDHRGQGYVGSEVNADNPEVVEIWNLVFMQYNRQEDHTLRPLPSVHVDTGMGLERMTAVLCGTRDNYNTDLFQPLFEVIRKTCSCVEYQSSASHLDVAYRTLADHARMITVAISDDLLPSGQDLGHKLRGIIHRCIRLCQGQFHTEPRVLLPRLVSKVVETLGGAFPELVKTKEKVRDIVCATIELHEQASQLAAKTFRKFLNKLGSRREIRGEELLLLESGHFGSPMSVDTVIDLAGQAGLTVDISGYNTLVEQRQLAVSSERVLLPPDPAQSLVVELSARHIPATEDEFKYCYSSRAGQYDFTEMMQASSPCRIVGLSSQGQTTEVMERDCSGEIILDRTCFYAEAGGQASDSGFLESETGQFSVTEVQNRQGLVVHYGHVSQGYLQNGQSVTPSIAPLKREGCMRNHTATHLLNTALTSVSPSSQQQGSNVSPYKFSFDFLSLGAFGSEQVSQVEESVREMIQKSCSVSRHVMSLQEAASLPNVTMLQNEEYPEQVSVIRVQSPDGSEVLSSELCGGTHVTDTVDLQEFCILQSGTKAQNVKRITAVTGSPARQAHLTGQGLASLCQLLQLLVDNDEQAAGQLTETSMKIQEVLVSVSKWRQELESLLQLDHSDRSGARDMWTQTLGDLDKTEKVLSSLYPQLIPAQITSPDKPLLMKEIVSTINKCRQLDLVPKTQRDRAAECTHSLTHKVTEVVNTRNSRILQRLIDQRLSQSDSVDQRVVCVEHELDLSARQMVKLLSQRSDNMPVLCVGQEVSGGSRTMVLCLPLSLWQPLGKEEISKIIPQKGSQKSSVGKAAKTTKRAEVYTFSVSADTPTHVLCDTLHAVLKPR